MGIRFLAKDKDLQKPTVDGGCLHGLSLYISALPKNMVGEDLRAAELVAGWGKKPKPNEKP